MNPSTKTPPPDEQEETPAGATSVGGMTSTAQEAPAADVDVRYLGSGTFSIGGAVTDRTYVFRGHGSVLAVDAADAESLLQLELRRQRCCGRGEQVTRPFAPA